MLGASYPHARLGRRPPPIIEAMDETPLPSSDGAGAADAHADAVGGTTGGGAVGNGAVGNGPVGAARFLTLADTAELLNVSVGQAYALVRSGELPAIKVGGHGHWRVERSVLEGYIEAKYEESRRMSLWQQSDFASLREYSFGTGSIERGPFERGPFARDER